MYSDFMYLLIYFIRENFNRLIDEQDPLALHLEMDDVSRKKNLRAFTMAVVGIVLMVIEVRFIGDAKLNSQVFLLIQVF